MRKAIRSPWIAPFLIAILGGSAARARQVNGLPAGTQIQVRLLDELDTGKARAGQTFSATVASPVVMGGRTVLPRGAKVSGRVVDAVSSGRLSRPASLTLELRQAGGGSMETEPLRIDAKSHLLRNMGIIGGESGAGAILGAAAGGRKGATIGAAIGAGAGIGTAYLTGKKEIVLPVETVLTFAVAGGGSGSAVTVASRRDPEVPRASRQPSGSGGWFGPAQSPYFCERDQRLIRRYYAMNTGNLPPGLAKRGGHLPPGLEKHLERDGTLPPGLQKRMQPFPEELEEQLTPLPAGYARVTLAARALILGPNNMIIDLMFIRQGRHERHGDEDDDRDED